MAGPQFAELPPEAKFKVIKFGAPWCHYCVLMKNKKTLEHLRERHTALVTLEDVNVDKDEKRANAYGVKSMPLIVIEDEAGHELVRKGGALTVDELEKLLALATRKWKAKKPVKAASKAEDDEDEDEDLDEEGEIDDLNEDPDDDLT